MKNFVDETWLKENADSVKIVDVRGDYEEGHIPGAISLPFERYFVDTPSIHGGRNPFPICRRYGKKPWRGRLETRRCHHLLRRRSVGKSDESNLDDEKSRF